ncbi:hypothetical protein G6F22_020595 [Rhizopus arrhizus]|nr:hypothetical protein G6F22_020595 [Rhizopus arrhizus]
MPRVGTQVFQLRAILGREDEAEMVPVVGAAFLEGVEVGHVGLRPVGLARLAVAAHAVALDVVQVLGERLRAGPLVIHQQRLDGHAPRHGLASRAAGPCHPSRQDGASWTCRCWPCLPA